MKKLFIVCLIVFFLGGSLVGCTTLKTYDPTGQFVTMEYTYPMFQNKSWTFDKKGEDVSISFNSDTKPFYDAILGMANMATEMAKKVPSAP